MGLSNQFGLQREKGLVSPLTAAGNNYTCVVDASETAAIGAGTAVKIKDVAGSRITVEAADANSDDIFGFVEYNVKKSAYVAGETVNVVADNGVMLMEAGGAIAAGADVEYVVTGAKVITGTNTGARLVGKALNKAANADIIPVLVKTPTANVVPA